MEDTPSSIDDARRASENAKFERFYGHAPTRDGQDAIVHNPASLLSAARTAPQMMSEDQRYPSKWAKEWVRVGKCVEAVQRIDPDYPLVQLPHETTSVAAERWAREAKKPSMNHEMDDDERLAYDKAERLRNRPDKRFWRAWDMAHAPDRYKFSHLTPVERVNIFIDTLLGDGAFARKIDALQYEHEKAIKERVPENKRRESRNDGIFARMEIATIYRREIAEFYGMKRPTSIDDLKTALGVLFGGDKVDYRSALSHHDEMVAAANPELQMNSKGKSKVDNKIDFTERHDLPRAPAHDRPRIPPPGTTLGDSEDARRIQLRQVREKPALQVKPDDSPDVKKRRGRGR